MPNLRVSYEPKTITLAAGESVKLPGDIRFFLFYDATNAAKVSARFGSSKQGTSGSFFALIKGFKNGPLTDIDVVEILNTDAAPNTISVVYGAADFDYTRDTIIGSLTVADGGDATQGAKADAAATADAGTFSVVALLKRMLARITTLFDAKGVRVRGQTASMTATADTDVIAAPAAGTHLVIHTIVLYNSHATVQTEVAIKDGATELFRVNLKAGSATTGLEAPVIQIPRGLQLTTATALRAQNITTGSATRVAAFGVIEAD